MITAMCIIHIANKHQKQYDIVPSDNPTQHEFGFVIYWLDNDDIEIDHDFKIKYENIKLTDKYYYYIGPDNNISRCRQLVEDIKQDVSKFVDLTAIHIENKGW